MELNNKLKDVYAKLLQTDLVKTREVNESYIKEFSDILNTLTVQECAFVTMLHDANNMTFKKLIHGWGEHLLVPTSSLRYHLGVAALIDIDISAKFTVTQSDGFVYKLQTDESKTASRGKYTNYAQTPRQFKTGPRPTGPTNTRYPPPMGKGKYDKETRLAHKAAKNAAASKTAEPPLQFSFSDLGSWDEVTD